MLVAVTALLGAFYLQWKVGLRQGGGPPAGGGILAFVPSRVEAIVGNYAGETLRLRRAGSGWREAGGKPLSGRTVDAFLADLSAVRGTKMARTGGAGLAAFGLARPALRLRLKLWGGAERTLEVGNLTMDRSGYYALTGDGVVEEIPVTGMDTVSGFILLRGHRG